MTTKANAQAEVKFVTPVFRVSFPSVFAPRKASNQPGAEAKYSISMIFPKVISDPAEKALFEKLKAAVSAVAVAKWGPDRTKWPTATITAADGSKVVVSLITSPWHDGAEKDSAGYGKDTTYASASSKFKPGLISTEIVHNPVTGKDEFAAITDPNGFYPGCYARATVTVFAYDNKKLGVSFGLRNIQKIRDGEVLGGGGSANDDFDAIPAPGGQPAAATAAPAATPAAGPLGI